MRHNSLAAQGLGQFELVIIGRRCIATLPTSGSCGWPRPGVTWTHVVVQAGGQRAGAQPVARARRVPRYTHTQSYNLPTTPQCTPARYATSDYGHNTSFRSNKLFKWGANIQLFRVVRVDRTKIKTVYYLALELLPYELDIFFWFIIKLVYNYYMK